MNTQNITDLDPKRVFYYFNEIASIPHGSRNTKAISDYLIGFADTHGLKFRQDDMGNVIIWKNGKGKTPVILQGHMDMVCEKEPDCDKDMEKEGLDLYIDADELKAKGTTLGGDDGIAVAMTLAILEDDDPDIPPIEAIFTVDEEIGMLGAAAIDVSDIDGRTMINIDSEAEGVLTVSCAGGVVANAIMDIVREEHEKRAGLSIYDIRVDGLIGGHSGIEIHKNRANAIVLLGRLLQRLRDEEGIRIIDIDGGAKDNAIAVSAHVRILLSVNADAAIQRITEEYMSDIRSEFSTTDPGISIISKKMNEDDIPDNIVSLDERSTDHLIYMLCCLPNGIQRMSPDVEGLVQTSLNMGILKITGNAEDKDERVILTFCVRSSVASEKDALKRRLKDGMSVIGGIVEFEGEYPGWQYLKDSKLRELIREVYISQYKKEPVIEAVHAGVECGFFADKLPELDCVSIGPDLSEIHTFRESMNILSVGRTYDLVREVLRRIAVGDK